jgi:hypothetical protein
MNIRSRILLLNAVVLLSPLYAGACPCVDTEVVRVDHAQRRLVATISETSRVMVTAALWELLETDVKPLHSDWLGRWQVSFYSSPEAAAGAGSEAASAHVADYDRAMNRLILWPELADRREEITLEIR